MAAFSGSVVALSGVPFGAVGVCLNETDCNEIGISLDLIDILLSLSLLGAKYGFLEEQDIKNIDISVNRSIERIMVCPLCINFFNYTYYLIQ